MQKSTLTIMIIALAGALAFVPAVPAQDDAERAMAGMQKPVVYAKASTILDRNVTNKTGESLGEIEDLVFNTNGDIAYAVLSFGGFLGMGEKFFAVPWSSFTYREDGSQILDVPEDRLRQAPGFDKNNWPDMANPDWSREVDVFYAYQPKDRSWGGKASNLLDGDVTRPDGSEVADVEEIIIDTGPGTALLLVVNPDDSLVPADTRIVIPWSATKVDPKNDKFICSAPDATLRTAPSFKHDAWPTIDRAFAIRAHTHFGRSLTEESPAGMRGERDADRPVAGERDLGAGSTGLVLSSRLVGARCLDADNADLGRVRDVVITPQGAFVIIEPKDTQENLRAVPAAMVRTTGDGSFAIKTSNAVILQGPAVRATELTATGDGIWITKTIEYYKAHCPSDKMGGDHEKKMDRDRDYDRKPGDDRNR